MGFALGKALPLKFNSFVLIISSIFLLKRKKEQEQESMEAGPLFLWSSTPAAFSLYVVTVF